MTNFSCFQRTQKKHCANSIFFFLTEKINVFSWCVIFDIFLADLWQNIYKIRFFVTHNVKIKFITWRMPHKFFVIFQKCKFQPINVPIWEYKNGEISNKYFWEATFWQTFYFFEAKVKKKKHVKKYQNLEVFVHFRRV